MFYPKRSGIPTILIHKTLFPFSLLFLRKYKNTYVKKWSCQPYLFPPPPPSCPTCPAEPGGLSFIILPGKKSEPAFRDVVASFGKATEYLSLYYCQLSTSRILKPFFRIDVTFNHTRRVFDNQKLARTIQKHDLIIMIELTANDFGRRSLWCFCLLTSWLSPDEFSGANYVDRWANGYFWLDSISPILSATVWCKPWQYKAKGC